MEHPARPATETGIRDAVLVENGDGCVIEISSSAGWGGGADLTTLVDTRLVDHVGPADRDRLAQARRAADVAQSGTATVELEVGSHAVPCAITVHPTSLGTMIVLQDLAPVRRLTDHAALLQRITALANEGSDTETALVRAHDDISATLDWRAGRIHRLGGDTTDPLLAAATRAAGPVTSEDDGSVAVPVRSERETTHVLSWSGVAPDGLDDDLRRTLATIGDQLGLVVGRDRVLTQLEEQRQLLERSNADLERFAYIASHDLQEPLRKIVSFSELLEQVSEPDTDEEAEFLGYIVDSARRMQTLIRDLLAYSRAGRRTPDLATVDLASVLDEVVRDLSMAMDEVDAEIVVEPLDTVLGDHGQLREALQNVLSNSLKYRDPDRRPQITVSSHRVDDRVVLELADNGIGVPPEHREQVFELFRRLHPRHEHGGTGIGLAMVARIVQRNGGSVRLTDGPDGVGTTVVVELPSPEEPT